jgi:hypothetical protein
MIGTARNFVDGGKLRRKDMPVILLWGIPTLLVVGGGGYWLMHLHH